MPIQKIYRTVDVFRRSTIINLGTCCLERKKYGKTLQKMQAPPARIKRLLDAYP